MPPPPHCSLIGVRSALCCVRICGFRYVKVVLTLISLAGDHVTEEVWHRVLQIIVNQQGTMTHDS